jgi:hypothetical protein
MLKKSLVFAGLALLLGALIVTGCFGPIHTDKSGPEDDIGKGPGPSGTIQIDGSNLTLDTIDDAIKNYSVIEIKSGTVLPAGLIDFKETRLKVLGLATTTGDTIINASGVTFEWEPGAKITLSAGDVFIHAASFDVSKADNSSGAVLVPLQTGTITPGPHFAVKGPITISTAGPTSVNVIAAGDLSGKNLYVVGNITVGGNFSADTVTAFGNISFGTGSLRVVGGTLAATGSLIAGTGSTGITLSNEAHNFRGVTGLAGSPITTGTKGIIVNGAVKDGEFATEAKINGKVEFTGKNNFKGALENTVAATYIFNTHTVIAGVLTSGTGGLTIAGKGGVTLDKEPVLVEDLTISGTGVVKFADSSDFSNSPADIKINDGGKLILGGNEMFTLGFTRGRILLSTTTDITISSLGTAGGSFNVINNDVAITAEPDGATISGGKISAFKKPKSGSPDITVAAGKTLTIDAGTEIALNGNPVETVGSITLKDGSGVAKIVFAGAGAKLSTALANVDSKVTGKIGGGIIANNGAVGSGLEIYSTEKSGSQLKLGYITPAPDAAFDGTANVVSGPVAGAGSTRISSTLTVTDL